MKKFDGKCYVICVSIKTHSQNPYTCNMRQIVNNNPIEPPPGVQMQGQTAHWGFINRFATSYLKHI